jgi:hypothetical protein
VRDGKERKNNKQLLIWFWQSDYIPFQDGEESLFFLLPSLCNEKWKLDLFGNPCGNFFGGLWGEAFWWINLRREKINLIKRENFFLRKNPGKNLINQIQ